MKLVILLLTVTGLQLSAKSSAQLVTLRENNVSIGEVFEQVYEQTGYQFVCTKDMLSQAHPVSIHVRNASLQEVLRICFEDQPFTYILKNKAIIVKHKSPPKVKLLPELKVSGRITDEASDPLAGVTIVVKGTSIGTVSDANGEYNLLAPNMSDTLVFSFIGYEKQVIPIHGATNINVRLEAIPNSMNQIVVVGMSNKQTKRSITGSIATIQTKELKQSPVANLSNALAGRLPGLFTVQATGNPGFDAAKLYIRGISTYGPNKNPLIVIDGLPRDIDGFSQIDPDEVASVTILKDATSSALYGIQGANGVIVVTTKRGGSNQKPSISFTAQEAVQQPILLPKNMDSYNLALYANEKKVNDGLPKTFDENALKAIKDGNDPYMYPDINWFDMMLRQFTPQRRYNLNISGSTGVIRYFISGSFLRQESILKYSDIFEKRYGLKSKFDRYNFRSNVNIDATKMLHLKIDLAGRLGEVVGPAPGYQNIFNNLSNMDPWQLDIFNPNGTLGAGSPASSSTFYENPYGLATQSGYHDDYTNDMYGTLSAKHDLDFITTGLSVEINFSFQNDNVRNTTRSQAFDAFWYRGVDNNGDTLYDQISIKSPLSTTGSGNISRSTYLDARINYGRLFGQHAVRGQLMANRSLSVQNSVLPNVYQGLSGHFTYSYKNRYFFETNLGYNGSENFPKGRRYGFFPAFSAGWVISDESFIRDNSLISFLKLRGSYGIVGNDKIGGDRWLFISDYATGGGGFFFGETPTAQGGFIENRVGNPFVTWEKSQKANIGVDLSLLKDRNIEITFDVFREKRLNILTAPGKIPDFLGIANLAPRNSGEVVNQGFDGEFKFSNNFGKVSTFLNFNITVAKNKIFQNDQPKLKYPYQDLRGYPVGYQLGYRSIGYFKDSMDIAKSPVQKFTSKVIPGDLKYEDINHDGMVDADDRVPIQVQNVPRFQAGVSLGASFKGFDISALIHGATGGTALLITPPSRAAINLYHWTPERGDQAKVPVPHSSPNNQVVSTFWVQKTDYIKLRNAEIGYQFPAAWLKFIHIKYARIFINGQNLLLRDKLWIKDRDPESAAASSPIRYPIQRIFNAGINIKL